MQSQTLERNSFLSIGRKSRTSSRINGHDSLLDSPDIFHRNTIEQILRIDIFLCCNNFTKLNKVETV